MIGVIDIGTHSVKWLLFDGRVRDEAAVVTRLGWRLAKTGRIVRPGPTERAVRSFLRRARGAPVRIVATHALRSATNAAALLRRWPWKVDVLTPAQECRYSFAGGTTGFRGRVTAIDIGGGSTEIMTGKNGRLRKRRLLAIGCATLRSDPAPWLARVRGFRAPKVVAIGGTAATIARMSRRRMLSLALLDRWQKRLDPLTNDQRAKIPGLPRDRADVIVGGLAILRAALRRLGARSAAVSFRGLRYGVAIEMLKRYHGAPL